MCAFRYTRGQFCQFFVSCEQADERYYRKQITLFRFKPHCEGLLCRELLWNLLEPIIDKCQTNETLCLFPPMQKMQAGLPRARVSLAGYGHCVGELFHNIRVNIRVSQHTYNLLYLERYMQLTRI